MVQMAKRLAARGLADEAEFLRLARNRKFIAKLGIEADTLEGYLFPTTYGFAKYSGTEELIGTMVAFTWKAFTPPA